MNFKCLGSGKVFKSLEFRCAARILENHVRAGSPDIQVGEMAMPKRILTFEIVYPRRAL